MSDPIDPLVQHYVALSGEAVRRWRDGMLCFQCRAKFRFAHHM